MKRSRAHDLVASTKHLLMQAALRTPAHRHAVVSGTPDDEGNCVEVVRRLAERLPVYWLTSGDPTDVAWITADLDSPHPVRVVRKDRLAGYAAYLTAKYVFFTHGLYGSPTPPRHKVVVNMWHGDGPKLSRGFAHVRSTYAVAGTRLWGDQRSVYFGVAPEAVLVTGNPRVDQFARPPDAAALRRLGLDPDKPFVLWMPTYRSSAYRGRRLAAMRHGTDARDLTEQDSVVDLGRELARLADRLGVTVAVKPHPLDVDEYVGLGLPVIDSDDLRRERLSVYQLLGRSAGLVTDYSSVWTDYLVLDRPIGFYCPDLEEYEENRGLNVSDYLSLIPGPRLTSLADFEAFLHECLQPSEEWRAIRAGRSELVGAETRLGATERLLDAVAVPRLPVDSPVPAPRRAARAAAALRRRLSDVGDRRQTPPGAVTFRTWQDPISTPASGSSSRRCEPSSRCSTPNASRASSPSSASR